jgi:hypothetical protein
LISPETRQSVRKRYGFCCAYCGVSETDVGGELTIDHHKPLTAGGGDDPDNLVYACFRCNLYKGALWPGKTEAGAGRRILHPLLDDPAQHYFQDPKSCRLLPITETGRYHIAALRLNREALVEHRLRRQHRTLIEEERDLLRKLAGDQFELLKVKTLTAEYLASQIEARKRKRDRRR